MRINHLYGRSVADTAAMVALTRRTPWAVRTLCERDPEGYDVKKCTATLADNPHHGRLLTAADAQKYLGIPAGTVRAWASAGRLDKVDRDPRGYPLYDAAQLVKLMPGEPT